MTTSDDAWQELSRKIVARRRQLGMRSQEELAKKAGVSLATITRLERGRRLVRRSRSWDLIETALEWPEGYIERQVNEIAFRSGFVIQASELSELEPKARSLIKNALIATMPDATAREIVAAENAAIKALRENGFLPPEE